MAIFVPSLLVPTTPAASTTAPAWAASNQPASGDISATIFFTDPGLSRLSLDANSIPMVNTTIGTAQTCTGYTSKGHNCINPTNWYVVQQTNPAQVRAWINITRTTGPSLRALRLNETLPVDWAINPSWGIRSTGGIHTYWSNTTRLATNPDITQYSSITVSGSAPQIVHITIPDFNKTALHHPMLPGQSILFSVTMTYTRIGQHQSSVNYPKAYTATADLAVWNQTSFTGTETVKSTSASFVMYGRTPIIVSQASDLWTTVSNILAQLIFPGILIAIILVVAYFWRGKQKPEFSESRPLAA